MKKNLVLMALVLGAIFGGVTKVYAQIPPGTPPGREISLVTSSKSLLQGSVLNYWKGREWIDIPDFAGIVVDANKDVLYYFLDKEAFRLANETALIKIEGGNRLYIEEKKGKTNIDAFVQTHQSYQMTRFIREEPKGLISFPVLIAEGGVYDTAVNYIFYGLPPSWKVVVEEQGHKGSISASVFNREVNRLGSARRAIDEIFNFK